MRCEEIRSRFAEYVNESLEPADVSLVNRHLQECGPCRAEARDLLAIWTRLGDIPSSEPGLGLRPRFESMLVAFEQGLEEPTRRWWPRQPALQFALSLGFLFVGVVAGRQLQSLPAVSVNAPSAEIADLRRELSDMRQLVALSLMRHESASDRLRGVSWSHQLQKPDNEVLAALLDTLMRDSNVNVRLATIDALRQFGDQPDVRRGVIDAMAHESSPMVQIGLIDLVVDLKEKEAVGMLRRLSTNEKLNEAVRERAGKGIARLE